MEEFRMTPRGKELLAEIQQTLWENEELIMESNKVLGDILFTRYGDRMGFNEDGSYSRNGRVIWPERMVEDE